MSRRLSSWSLCFFALIWHCLVTLAVEPVPMQPPKKTKRDFYLSWHKIFQFLFLNDLPETESIANNGPVTDLNVAYIGRSVNHALKFSDHSSNSPTYDSRGSSLPALRVGNVSLYDFGKLGFTAFNLEKQISREKYISYAYFRGKGYRANDFSEVQRSEGFLENDTGITSEDHEMKYLWIPRGQHFSFLGPQNGSEQQLVSAWSPVIGLSLRYHNAKGKRGLPPKINGNKTRLEILSSEVPIGISGTLVLWGFYLSGGYFVVPSASRVIEMNEEAESSGNLGELINGSMGVHRRAFFAGLHFESRSLNIGHKDSKLVWSTKTAAVFIGTWL